MMELQALAGLLALDRLHARLDRVGSPMPAAGAVLAFGLALRAARRRTVR
jgi:hypothetical protein